MLVNNNEAEEILDLVNEKDQVIGRITRSEAYAANLSNFRVINAFLVNRQGQLWIPRRTAYKRLFPLHLDCGFGGHVSSDESYEEAFTREMQEEIGLTIDQISYQDIGTLTPHQHNVSAFMHVYKVEYNQTPPFNPDDFVESFWLTPQQLLEKIKNGDKAKNDLPKLVMRFFL